MGSTVCKSLLSSVGSEKNRWSTTVFVFLKRVEVFHRMIFSCLLRIEVRDFRKVLLEPRPKDQNVSNSYRISDSVFGWISDFSS